MFNFFSNLANNVLERNIQSTRSKNFVSFITIHDKFERAKKTSHAIVSVNRCHWSKHEQHLWLSGYYAHWPPSYITMFMQGAHVCLSRASGFVSGLWLPAVGETQYDLPLSGGIIRKKKTGQDRQICRTSAERQTVLSSPAKVFTEFRRYKINLRNTFPMNIKICRIQRYLCIFA